MSGLRSFKSLRIISSLLSTAFDLGTFWPNLKIFFWKKLKNLTFLGEIFQTQTQTKGGWPDPTRVKKFWPGPFTNTYLDTIFEICCCTNKLDLLFCWNASAKKPTLAKFFDLHSDCFKGKIHLILIGVVQKNLKPIFRIWIKSQK